MQTNKTTNVILGVIALALVVIIVLVAVRSSQPAPTPVADQPITQAVPSMPAPAAHPTPGTPPTPPATSNTFSSSVAHFQIILPTGASLSSEAGADGATSFYPRNYSGYLRMIGVHDAPCAADGGSSTTNLMLNGITFLKNAGTGAYGGMESNSIDASYCARNNGRSYLFGFTKQYNRVDGSTPPDVTTTQQAFDQEMANLHFAFTQ